MFLLAHAGHWLVNAAYFAPVVGFLAWLGFTELRGRRERKGESVSDGSVELPASALARHAWPLVMKGAWEFEDTGSLTISHL